MLAPKNPPISLFVLLVAAATVRGEEPLRYNRDIRPILSENCFSCHGPDEKQRKAGLRLDLREAALKAAESGDVAIVPGEVKKSALVRHIESTDKDEIMPPPKANKHLTDAQKEKLRQWIAQGARYEPHWSFVAPVAAVPPVVKKADWARNDLDRFILARLESEGLAPSPEATKETLVRRLSLDLTGLPPTPAEVDAFVADKSPQAYEKVVDRLLGSPHYGERMAVSWLDAARYGDTHGYEKDPPRNLWLWRDWVIRAFNENMRFDQFTIEQLAGDLLPSPTTSQLVATGFHRNSLLNDEGGTDAEEFRMAALNDRVETTATVWLGLTMNCVQCHSHKYDPIQHREYYQFLAIFNNTEDGGNGSAPEWQAPTREQEAALKVLHEQVTKLEAAPDAALPEGQAALEKARKVEKDFVAKFSKTMILRERRQPRETRIALRGNFRTPGDKVEPGVPAFLPALPKDEPANRLALARWLVAKENPLTARVIVNRYWALLFGMPIVDSVEDFGARGEAPTHPDLLDRLAVEFLRSGWDVKALFKLMVTSATYRQASAIPPGVLEKDPDNKLLARGPRFRVEAEMVRDLALAASGRLTAEIGGPSVMPPQPPGIWENSFGFESFAGNQRYKTDEGAGRYRRALYTYWRRTAPYPALATFDLVSRDVCKVKRSRTNTPLQALIVLNDPMFFECAGAMGRSLLALPAATPEARAAYGLKLCVARAAKPREVEMLVAMYRDALGIFTQDPARATALIQQGRVEAGAANPAELAAWITVANVLLNLDETLTKS